MKILFQSGDYFRGLWGPYAGWAQSVSIKKAEKKHGF